LITADGSRVVYTVLENQKSPLYIVPATGGVPERLCDDCGRSMDWSPDGKKIVYSWGQPTHWSVIDAGTRERFEVLHHPKYNTHVVRFSPDGRWISFNVPMEAEAGRSTVYIAPLRPGGVPENEWIAMSDGSAIDSHAWWSPDGNLLYFISRRDGFSCIWTQRLVRDTKRPVGSPQEFYHLHGARRSIIAEGGPNVTSDKLVFTMFESTGNIWMAKLE
jgi:Tol biopolymer transport system component